jgi:uncharacterized damage-inducible protein DinB
MNVSELLNDAFGRLPELVDTAVTDLTPEQLRWAPAPGANPIGWLIWHLTRIEDAHLAELLATGQVYVDGQWAARFGAPADSADVGYGHTPEQVAALRPENVPALVDYFTAVHERAQGYVADLTEDDLDRIVDKAWDPPVTLGARLISILDDAVQHAGQAAYVRGLLPR